MYDPKRGYPAVVPCVLYDDPVAAADWLMSVVDAREAVRATLPDGWVGHLELEHHGSIILLGHRGGEFDSTSSVTQVFVPDVQDACDAAIRAGGALASQPVERPWGIRQATVTDPEGQRWVLCQHVRDTDPAEWYGQILAPVRG